MDPAMSLKSLVPALNSTGEMKSSERLSFYPMVSDAWDRPRARSCDQIT